MLEKITAIIANRLDCDTDAVTEDTRIEDLGADSLDLVEILMAVEEAFSISVPDEDMPNFKTAGDILAYVEANS